MRLLENKRKLPLPIYDFHLLTFIYLVIHMHLESVLVQGEYAFAIEQAQVITVA